MTEEQIKDGYDRLDGALAPPLDAALRVERRVTARRRHRRTAVAGAATLGVLAVGGAVIAMASGDDGTGPTVAAESTAPVSTLVMTRPDGSTYAFDDVTVSCDPPPNAAGDPVDVPGQIWMYSPIELTGSPKDDNVRATEPFVYFEGTVAKLQGEQTLSIPIDGPGGSDSYPLTLFIADPEGASNGNEVSSSAGGSGTVRVVRAACEPAPVLELEVDATLGSEVRQNTLDLAGALR